MFLVISYDIIDNKRRLKVSNTLLDYGGQRVQKSVFEVHITPKNFGQLEERLQTCYNEEEDSIRIYLLCENCQPKVKMLGVAEPTDEPGLLII